MDLFSVFTTVLATVLGSVAIALVTDYFRTRRRRRNLLSALYTEIMSNSVLAKRLMAGWETVFEILPFHTGAYTNAMASGMLTGLPSSIVDNLEEVYELISMHNRQTLVLQSEFIPRDRGYRERITSISQRLDFLKENLLGTF